MPIAQLPPKDRPAIASRTLDQIHEDHEKFIADGGDINKAKFFNNCPMDALFDVPLNQVLLHDNYARCLHVCIHCRFVHQPCMSHLESTVRCSLLLKIGATV